VIRRITSSTPFLVLIMICSKSFSRARLVLTSS